MPETSTFHPVDLLLPSDKKPTDLNALHYFNCPGTVPCFISDYAIGSSTESEKIYHQGQDLGLFQCVYEAWRNHYNLRTSPEDWWFPVACKIAKKIDASAKSKYSGDKVRELFVNHQGKDKICVDVDVFTIDQVDYDDFFTQMSSEITKRIKVPKYAEAMQNDFSSSTTTHHIASQINLMASVQEFFSYEMGLCGCGIKGVEMFGEQRDWDKLAVKLQLVRKQLEQIQSSLGLYNDWWDHVEFVFTQLAKTFAVKQQQDNKNNKDEQQQAQEIADFWADIFMVGQGWKYGPSGFGGHAAEEYNGWLVQFLTGYESILKEDFFSSANVEKLKGLNSVPMKITMKHKTPPVSDEATLTAGILGFQIHDKETTFNGVPSFQPHHMWALSLPGNSPLRG